MAAVEGSIGGRPQCLLIMPRSFYSFCSILDAGLKAKGYGVTTANDEYPENFIGKILGKLDSPLSRIATHFFLKKRYLDGKHYDLIIIIKGRGIGSKLPSLLRNHADKVVGYHFDSFRYDRAPSRWLHDLGSVTTFDYRDGEENSIPIVELFSSMPVLAVGKKIERDLSIIVRNHSDRLSYVDQIMKNFAFTDVFIHIYEQNIVSFLSNFLRSPLLYIKYRKFIKFKPLAYEKYTQVLVESEFTVDYAHPKQTGITMRCFEAASAGTKIITNNRYVRRSEFFDESNSIVMSEDVVFMTEYESLRGRAIEPRHRTIDAFLDELISHAHCSNV